MTQITEAAVVDALTVPWVENHVMALRTLGRVVAVMTHASRCKWVASNPLSAERMKEKLPSVAKTRSQHHPAMALRAVPGFMCTLAAEGTVMADLFRFLILSGVRCNEAAGARWSEIDVENRVWTIPGGDPTSRLKGWQHGSHTVPITDGMLAILKARQAARDDGDDDGDGLVFASPKGTPFNADQLTGLLRDNGFAKGMASVHGMRSTLRGFLAEHCEGERVIKELCLHHETRSDVELSYDRGSYLRERTGMMAAWDAYVAGKLALAAANYPALVLPLRHAVAA